MGCDYPTKPYYPLDPPDPEKRIWIWGKLEERDGKLYLNGIPLKKYLRRCIGRDVDIIVKWWEWK